MRPEPWRLLNEIDIQISGEVLDISWLYDGSIGLTTTREIVVHDKWLTDPLLVRDDERSIKSLSIFNLATRVHGRLPDHHPMLLVNYLVWGRYDLTKYSLALVFRYVKLLSEAMHVTSLDHVPMPLWKFFDDVAEEEQQEDASQKYDKLFADDQAPNDSLTPDINVEDSQQLIELLTKVQLPNITSVQQTILMSVIDTLVQIEAQKRTLDANGVRYVLFLRLFLYSSKALPPQYRPLELQSREIAWAFYSDSQDVLIEFCSNAFGGRITWPNAKVLGMGYWIKSNDTLKKFVETLGRNAYLGRGGEDRDPVACAIWYAALKKRKVLHGLWKTASSNSEAPAMVKFLGNDFAEERWQKAASKNAYVLMSKQ
ncbi:regulator of (H+)-ATPase in vacuolar membrane, partial [Gonapodya sp. JEL0774]